jgi:hypothetical protein
MDSKHVRRTTKLVGHLLPKQAALPSPAVQVGAAQTASQTQQQGSGRTVEPPQDAGPPVANVMFLGRMRELPVNFSGTYVEVF